MEQPDGSYPRVNSELIRTGNYDDMIVSVVGRFDVTNSTTTGSSLMYSSFICSDDQPIELITEHAAALSPEVMTVVNDMVFEIIGQAQQSSKLVVRIIV